MIDLINVTSTISDVEGLKKYLTKSSIAHMAQDYANYSVSISAQKFYMSNYNRKMAFEKEKDMIKAALHSVESNGNQRITITINKDSGKVLGYLIGEINNGVGIVKRVYINELYRDAYDGKTSKTLTQTMFDENKKWFESKDILWQEMRFEDKDWVARELVAGENFNITSGDKIRFTNLVITALGRILNFNTKKLRAIRIDNKEEPIGMMD